MRKIDKFIGLVVTMLIILILGIGIVIVNGVSVIDSYPNIEKIKSSQLFDLEESDYYVYFYEENCPYCKEVKDRINQFAESGESIYAINYDNIFNRVNKYNWEEIEAKYNKKIGTVDEKGNKNFLPGESEEKYLNSTETNQYGKVIRYQIIEITEDNVNQFTDLEIGDLYIEIQTPEIDYSAVAKAKDLIIAGVPTLLHIENGKIEEFYFDSIEIEEFLALYE